MQMRGFVAKWSVKSVQSTAEERPLRNFWFLAIFQFYFFDARFIQKSVEKATFNKAGAPDLQQAKPVSKQPMCKYMGDGDSCEGGDAGAVKSGFFNRFLYTLRKTLLIANRSRVKKFRFESDSLGQVKVPA